jgi:putative oxidoreductase
MMTDHGIVSALFHGFGATDAALLLNRLVLGMFFAISGFHKLFVPRRHQEFRKTLAKAGVPLLGVMEWFVAGVEFLGGLAVVVGLLSPLAALGLLAVSAVAALTTGGDKLPKEPLDPADTFDSVLYLPEVLYGAMATLVILAGPGAYSLDALLG